ncbi:MAG TPA: phosphatase PAP2 family protein [Actinophytocola sp.]|nr:phosphatase PAP2 family protein [Actinophytocola sp.]
MAAPTDAPDRLRVRVALVGLLFLATVALTTSVHGLTELDTALRQWMLAHRSSGLNTAATVVTTTGSSLVLAPVAGVLALVLGLRGRRSDALLVGVTALGAVVLGPLLKTVIERPRPPEDHLVVVNSFAYPSGHSLTSMAVLGVLTALAVRHLPAGPTRTAAVTAGTLLITAVGISRVYLGVHWPTDVLAGWLVGAVWLGVCLLLFGRRTETDGWPDP